jgi:hypothetical protein
MLFVIIFTYLPKSQWSTQQTSSMSQMHETGLLSTPGRFGPVLLSYVSNNDGKELFFLKDNLALPIYNCVSARFVVLEAVYLETLLYYIYIRDLVCLIPNFFLECVSSGLYG